MSNPPVLCVTALLASVEIFEEAGMERLRQKSLLITGYLEHLLREHLKDHLKIITPQDPESRGCQLSLVFNKDVEHVSNALKENGIICDVRKPSALRVSPTPLYNSFHEVWRFVSVLKSALE